MHGASAAESWGIGPLPFWRWKEQRAPDGGEGRELVWTAACHQWAAEGAWRQRLMGFS